LVKNKSLTKICPYLDGQKHVEKFTSKNVNFFDYADFFGFLPVFPVADFTLLSLE